MSFSDADEPFEEGQISSLISPEKPLKTMSSVLELTGRSDSHSSSTGETFQPFEQIVSSSRLNTCNIITKGQGLFDFLENNNASPHMN